MKTLEKAFYLDNHYTGTMQCMLFVVPWAYLLVAFGFCSWTQQHLQLLNISPICFSDKNVLLRLPCVELEVYRKLRFFPLTPLNSAWYFCDTPQNTMYSTGNSYPKLGNEKLFLIFSISFTTIRQASPFTSLFQIFQFRIMENISNLSNFCFNTHHCNIWLKPS